MTDRQEEAKQPGQAMKRDDWMLSGGGGSEGDAKPSPDYFADLGSYSRTKVPKPDKPNPDELTISSRELNTQFIQGKHIDEYKKESSNTNKLGGPGHQWRMMKLRRTYEAAEEEGRKVEEVALERFGSMQAFNEARAERQYLDDQQQQQQQGHRSKSNLSNFRNSKNISERDTRPPPPSRPNSMQIFRKPGEASNASSPSSSRQSSFRQNGYKSDMSKPSTPIPSVFTPTDSRTNSKLRIETVEDEKLQQPGALDLSQVISSSQSNISNSNPRLNSAALNKLSAKVMRAEMMGSKDAAELRAQLELETARAQSGGDQGFSKESKAGHSVGGESNTESHIQVLPTLDARGRLYDVGKKRSGQEDDKASRPGNRRKSRKFETRDEKTGDLLRYNADDDEHTLADLVRQERFTAGSADQKNADAEMANRITADQSFKDNVDYMDDNVERLARKKMKTDAMKRQFAVQNFARTKKALDTCQYCWQDDGLCPPRVTVVSSGTRSYLALPLTEVLTTGHCLIVPMQHYLSTLEADDDTWEEMKNFMKCLIQMAASRKQGVIFCETVKSLKQQRHSVIEAVPVDFGLFQELPGHFKQSILTTGDEWSQNKKLIEFSSSRSFRKSMVPQLPYFMVQWDHKGEKGYGHVIEEIDGHHNANNGDDDFDLAETSKGGGDFPSWFAAEIIGNLLELEPKRWRKPKRLYGNERDLQLSSFHKIWKPFDWTVMLDQ